MPDRTLLALFAHPDDEAFGAGGTLAAYAARGVRIVLVCATRGEVGEIADPALATPENLGAVREGELRCAARALGIAEPIFLDYRDSGMAGTPANDDPRAFVQAPEEAVVPRLVGIMRRLRPQVVLTFDPGGGYGHPDHIAIHRHTVAAFHAAGDAARHAEQGPPWQPARLVYRVMSRSFFAAMRERLAALEMDTSRYERFAQWAWPDERVQVALDVSGTVAAKWAAVNCHRTQLGPDHPLRRLPETVWPELMGREHFALAWPEPAPGLRLDDLFP